MPSGLNDLEQARLDLERQRLELEITKQRFEERKYSDETASRAEELAKLHAEREKAELESKNLKAPFYAKPAFVAAFFQGVALVVAVISALVSLGAWNTLRDASVAKIEAAVAKSEEARARDSEARAKEEQAKAEKEKDTVEAAAKFADGQREKAQSDEKGAEELRKKAIEDRDRAEYQAETAPIKALLESLAAKGYYPDHFSGDIRERQSRYEQVSEYQEVKLLVQDLQTSNQQIDEARAESLKEYSSDANKPLGIRLATLRVLVEVARQGRTGANLDKDRLMDSFKDLVKPHENEEFDTRALASVVDLFGKSEVSATLCDDYYLGYPRRSLEAFIWSESRGIDLSRENCQMAMWNWLEPEADDWRIFYQRRAGLAAGAEASKTYKWFGTDPNGGRSFPEIFLLLRNWATGGPRAAHDSYFPLESGSNMVEIGIKGENESAVMLWSPNLDDWERNPDAPRIFYLLQSSQISDEIRAIDEWAERNSDIVELIKERNLSRLRNCKPDLLLYIYENKYLGRDAVEKYCPQGTLSAAR